jgi:hypothetical protein
MGSGVSQPSGDSAVRKRPTLLQSVKRFSRRSTIDPSELPTPSVKWVLMGEPSSGRRTIAKHLTLMYTSQNKIDLIQANRLMVPQIRGMVVQQLQILARVAEKELQYVSQQLFYIFLSIISSYHFTIKNRDDYIFCLLLQ